MRGIDRYHKTDASYQRARTAASGAVPNNLSRQTFNSGRVIDRLAIFADQFSRHHNSARQVILNSKSAILSTVLRTFLYAKTKSPFRGLWPRQSNLHIRRQTHPVVTWLERDFDMFKRLGHEGIEVTSDACDFAVALLAHSNVEAYLHSAGLQNVDKPPLDFCLRRQSQHRSNSSFPPGRFWRSHISSAIMQGFIVHAA